MYVCMYVCMYTHTGYGFGNRGAHKHCTGVFVLYLLIIEGLGMNNVELDGQHTWEINWDWEHKGVCRDYVGAGCRNICRLHILRRQS